MRGKQQLQEYETVGVDRVISLEPLLTIQHTSVGSTHDCLLLELLLKCYKLCVSWNILFTYFLVSRGLFTPLQQYSFGAQCMHNCLFWCRVSEFWSIDLICYQLNIKLQFGLMCHGSPCCCFWMCIKLQLYKTLYNTTIVQNTIQYCSCTKHNVYNTIIQNISLFFYLFLFFFHWKKKKLAALSFSRIIQGSKVFCCDVVFRVHLTLFCKFKEPWTILA